MPATDKKFQNSTNWSKLLTEGEIDIVPAPSGYPLR